MGAQKSTTKQIVYLRSFTTHFTTHMAPGIFFEETQPFRQRGMEFLLLVVNTFLVLAYIAAVFFTGAPREETHYGLLACIALSAIATLVMKNTKLITQITAEGIQVRFSPVQRHFVLYRWEDVEQAFIRTYNPVTEYGGWGLRLGPSGSAYIAAGNVGLQLVLRDNFKILIGTGQGNALAEVLQRLGRL